MPKSQNFTEGKIFSPLIQFALPILAALLQVLLCAAYLGYLSHKERDEKA